MTPERFTDWLNGFVELEKGKMPSADQWKMIVDHLKLVYNKITPELGSKSTWEDKKIIEEAKKPAPAKTLDEIMKEFEKRLPVQPVTTLPYQPFQPTWVGPAIGTGQNPVQPGTLIC